MNGADLPPSSTPELRNALLNLYGAEYQALTTRNTYWLTLQYALWPILLLALGLIAQMQKDLGARRTVLFAAWMIQTIVLAYYSATLEQYTNVNYIERELRPTIGKLINDSSFWRYERYLKEHRGLHPTWWEGLPVLLSVGALIAAGRLNWPWAPRDYAALVAMALFAGFILKLARRCIALRKEFTQAA